MGAADLKKAGDEIQERQQSVTDLVVDGEFVYLKVCKISITISFYKSYFCVG